MPFRIEVLDPKDPSGPKAVATIEDDYVLRLHKYYPVQFQNLEAAKYVLEHPERIFSGIKRPVTNDGWCYVGRPAKYYVAENCLVPLPAHLVYGVYLNSRMILYTHRLEIVDTEDTFSPKDWKNRYGGRTWKTTS